MVESAQNDAAVNNGDGSSKAVRAGGWTDSERSQLMMRVLATLLPEGKGVEWKRIVMDGRSLKAMQGQWSTILGQIRDLNLGGNNASTPAKGRTGQKKNTTKKKSDGEDANEGEEAAEDVVSPKKPTTPRKRAAASAGEGSAKKRRGAKKTPAKVEAEGDEVVDEEVKPEETARETAEEKQQ